MLDLREVLADITAREGEYLDILFALLRQPSISTTGEGVKECAYLLKRIMEQQGILAKVIPTDGHPVVYGEVKGKPGALTVLVYGHYDVQPPAPLGEWISPPFEPTLRCGRVYARGSGDNKGQLLAHVLAAGALLRHHWPGINVKFLFDGEEECSSPSLPAFLSQHKALLQADVAISSDGPKHESGRPVVFFGVRGLVYVELRARGAANDLHSGNRGGVVPNPAWQLIHLLTKMYGPDGRCNIPGFYADIVPPTEYEEDLISKLPFDRKQFLAATGLKETSLTRQEYWRRLMFEPTFNICGLTSGYQGEGSKTIIPATATAKLDMRLVPEQDPQRIMQALSQFVAREAPDVEVIFHGSYPPSRTPADLPVCQAVIEAVREVSDCEPVVQPRLGGSTPDYLLNKELGLPSIWVPYANADENNHAPNENITVDDFMQGIRTTAAILYQLSNFKR